MFGWLKTDPKKTLNKAYLSKLEEAMHAQRNGNIRLYSELTTQAEELHRQILLLEK
jgi:hypothetical protein